MANSEDYFLMAGLGDDARNFTFVRYNGKWERDSVAEYLKSHASEFDAVAVFGMIDYSVARKAVEKNFVGPKILLQTTRSPHTPQPGQYRMEVKIPVLPSQFDSQVEAAFKEIPNKS